ncbi:hypothetical protein HU200_025314 [Digitaria exilis]|uniref:DNA (cytosine-5-)-methyltransferase n=1 Tax=Digitaria exilis TaxID=1010633 RepID=A0A835EXU3_9POAL|nr:hypothetical protein HU200_025314 [Digitaria exilis]
MSPDPAVAAPAATEPRRSSRKRFNSAAAVEAEIDREMQRAEARTRQRRAGPVAKPGPAKVAAETEGERDGADRDASRAQPRGKRRQSRAAKEKRRTRPGAGKQKAKETAEAQEQAAAVDDVCAEEPNSEAMAMEEEEEAVAALEAEEEDRAKAGDEGSAEKVGARKRVARPSTERRADASEDYFVGEPMPDHEARRRWPERYKTKIGRVESTILVVFKSSSVEEEELKARHHYTSASVDNVIYQLNDDVYVKRWAVDMNEYACGSLKYNHPRSKVRNEKAEDFFALLKEWDALCKKYIIQKGITSESEVAQSLTDDEDEPLSEDTYEVEKLLDICFGDPNSTGQVGLWFKGTVDVICGGPPCQGISGFNRFRKREDPLKDEKNKQMVVFMDIVEYKYVLMENVVDILKFADGFLGRYALSQLVAMNYQARLGLMVAGCYGLPQFRMRVFIWGALPSMQSVVAYDETEAPRLRNALFLSDAISDLPEVGNDQPKDVMDFIVGPKTEFQRYIRLNRKAMMDYSFDGEADSGESKLFDHQPLRLNDDDYERVRQIPLEKGANFRDLRGVKVGINNTVEWDPDVPRVLLSSGKPLVPDYAMSFIKGKSLKPFGRLWWDETVPTVVTRAEPHNQIILHPSQARVLTIRENARLQGFPDYYRLFGPIKQKYMQVGNAVAVPVARALGYSLGMAYLGRLDGDGPLIKLPKSFTRTSVFSEGQDVDMEEVFD